MGVSREDVEYISKLAKLSFDEKEKENLINELDKVVTYIDKLKEVSTEGIDIAVSPYELENTYREDIIEDSLKIQQVIKNSPASMGEYILVSRVIE